MAANIEKWNSKKNQDTVDPSTDEHAPDSAPATENLVRNVSIIQTCYIDLPSLTHHRPNVEDSISYHALLRSMVSAQPKPSPDAMMIF